MWVAESPDVVGADLSLIAILLVAVRLWAIIAVQVLWRTIVGPIWFLVAAALAIALALGLGLGLDIGTTPSAETLTLGPAVLAELVLGVVLGLAVSLPGYALLGAVDASSTVLSTASGPWRALSMSVVAAIAMAAGLHHPLLVALRELFLAWPVAQPLAWLHAVQGIEVARLGHGLVLLALTLATPALLAAAVADLGVRAVGVGPRPAADVTVALAPWLRVAAALVATGASWAAYDLVWAQRALGPLG